MSNETLMDAQDFAERLERSFDAEPPHRAPEDDLALGRQRLRRRRTATSLAALVTAGVLGAGASFMPGLLPDPAQELAPAGGTQPTAEEMLTTCMRKENVLHVKSGQYLSEAASLALMGDEPKLMSSAVIANRTEATLRSEDRKYWGDCQFRNAPDNGVKNAMSIYSTDVEFPRAEVAGVHAYERADETNQGLVARVDPALPRFETPCVSPLTGEDRWSFDATCPTFTMSWNDRRPPDVGAVGITTPDGVSTLVHTNRGYLSFAYTGDMTPAIADQVAAGEHPGAARIVFYDKDGNVLVDDHDPGHAQDGSLDIADFPSLAWWTK